MQAHQKGVEIKIVFDAGALSSQKQLMRLIQEGIPLLLFDSKKDEKIRFAPLMHHKFLLFKSALDGRALLSSGSLNLTQAGVNDNFENVMIRDNQEMIAKFEEEFLWLEQHSEKVVSAKTLTQKIDNFKSLRSKTKSQKIINSGVKKESKQSKKEIINKATKIAQIKLATQIVRFVKKK